MCICMSVYLWVCNCMSCCMFAYVLVCYFFFVFPQDELCYLTPTKLSCVFVSIHRMMNGSLSALATRTSRWSNHVCSKHTRTHTSTAYIYCILNTLKWSSHVCRHTCTHLHTHMHMPEANMIHASQCYNCAPFTKWLSPKRPQTRSETKLKPE